METLRTMFRVAVMLAALVIVYQGWQIYGPPADRLKSFALRIIEIAQAALGESDPAGKEKPIRTSDSPAPPPLAEASPVTGQVLQAQALVPARQSPAAPGETAAFPPPALAALAPAALVASADATTPEADLPALYSRLEGLGAVEPQLATWGNGGQLYRFCCRAAVGGEASLQRHFEAVAGEPRLAVQEVVAKVEAWRAVQQETADQGTLVR